MGYDKTKLKQIRGILVLAAILILALIHGDKIWGSIVLGLRILSPFIIGGVIAFVLNLPMNMIEGKMLAKWNGKIGKKLKRPVSMTLSLIFVLAIIVLVLIAVVPQLVNALAMLGTQIPAFIEDIVDGLVKLGKEYPQLQEEVAKLEETEIDWVTLGNNLLTFLKSGLGNVVTSTFSFATNLIGGIANGVISLIFALYILSQKEKLANQGRRVMTAYLPEKMCKSTEHVLSLLYRNFSKFITGQCLEAVILGTMFVIVMSLFRMPYAVMIGVLVAFTALIPIVGGFIGCAIGAFLILIESPMQALIFVILFLVIQQLEGNLIYPKVVGNSVGLPSLWVLMAVSVGGSLFGIAGMLAFIPLVSTLYALIRENVNARNNARQKDDSVGKDNSGSESENRNQTHDVRKEEKQPVNQKR